MAGIPSRLPFLGELPPGAAEGFAPAASYESGRRKQRGGPLLCVHGDAVLILRQGKRRIHSDKPPEVPAAPAEEPPRRARAPEAGARRPGQRAGKPSGTRQRPPREDRFAGSLPVKRGKGSRKKSGRQ